MTDLAVFTFSPAFGLVTSGPFALKLIKWLDIAGIPYRQVIQDNPGKGPNKKNPWVEIDGKPLADTEIIIETLAERFGFDIDAGLGSARRAQLHAARRMIEEHLHMVFEWEMFVHPKGAPFAYESAATMVPKVVAAPLARMFIIKMGRQLYARGLARHSPEIIFRKGRADVDAIEAMLEGSNYLGGDRVAMADVSAYGMLQPMAKWPMRTPVADYIKSRPVLLAYLDRMSALRAAERLAA